jgi:excinuclease ABC subunit A
MRLAGGLAVVSVIDGEDMLFSQNYACPDCNISIEELTPRMFSFNNPYGACPTCTGLGTLLKVDPAIVVPDPTKSLSQGAIRVSGWNSAEDGGGVARMYLEALARHYGFSLDVPVGELPEGMLDKVLYGTGGEKIRGEYEREHGSGSFSAPFEGIIPNIERATGDHSDGMKEVWKGYLSKPPLPDCSGIGSSAIAGGHGGRSFDPVVRALSVRTRAPSFIKATLDEKKAMIARRY